MAKKLEMVFTTDLGKTVTLSLAEPKSDLTRAAVTAVMQKMIGKNALAHANGALNGIKAVNIRTGEVTELA